MRSYFSLFGMILFKLINGLEIFVEINLYFSSIFFFFDGTPSQDFRSEFFRYVCSFARAFKFFITAHTSIIK